MTKKNFENQLAFLLFGGFFVAALLLIETDKMQLLAALRTVITG